MSCLDMILAEVTEFRIFGFEFFKEFEVNRRSLKDLIFVVLQRMSRFVKQVQ